MSNIPTLISIKEFINVINANTNSPIGENAIYKMVKEPGFPVLMVGNRFYIMIDKVKDWMENRFSQKTAQDPEEEEN